MAAAVPGRGTAAASRYLKCTVTLSVCSREQDVEGAAALLQASIDTPQSLPYSGSRVKESPAFASVYG